MDQKTLYQYEANAKDYIQNYSEHFPDSVYKLIEVYFTKDLALDLGCASGRDLKFLSKKNEVHGLDAVPAFVEHCRSTFPNINIIEDSLPDLKKISDSIYGNILCNAVLMHISLEQIPKAIKNISRILKSNGVIILSIRGVVSGKDHREADGRLFTPLSQEFVEKLFNQYHCKMIHHTEFSESPKLWHNYVFKKDSE